jgi:hypothetical protein
MTTTITTTSPNTVDNDDMFVIQNDINQHITAQQSLYTKLKASEFVLDTDKAGSGDPSLDVTPENVNNKLTEVGNMSDGITKEEELQRVINNYFNYNYKNNTKLRAQYFEMINNLNKELLQQNEELKKLRPELVNLETGTSTQFRNLKDIKRKYAEQTYYMNLYKICAFVQVFVIIAVALGFGNVIPKTTVIMVSAIIYVLLAAYVGYTVLFTNTDRDVQVFDRYKFPVDKDAVSKCDTSALAKKNKEREAEVDSKLITLLDERQSKTQCLVTPGDETDTTTTSAADITTTTTTTATATE